MATQAQIDANRRNAQASTGPKTDAGKANSSRNATRFGLFAANNRVPPGEEEIYLRLCHSLWDELAPVGALEEVAAAEYVRAIWLLRRCAVAAETLGMYMAGQCNEVDPMLADDCLRNEAAIARARALADNSRRRAKADLDKLQAERRARTPELQTEAARPAPVPEPSLDRAA